MNLIGTTVRDLLDHTLSEGLVVDVLEADKAAHDNSFRGMALQAQWMREAACMRANPADAQTTRQTGGRRPPYRGPLAISRSRSEAADPWAIMQSPSSLGARCVFCVISVLLVRSKTEYKMLG